jgi:hypothetical protein
MSTSADKFDAYTVVAVITPGAIVVLAALLLIPDPLQKLAPQGVTFGFFGVYLVVAYAVGHLLQAMGNLLEAVFWRILGGLPTNEIVKPSQSLIAPKQRDALKVIVQNRWGVELDAQDLLPGHFSGLTKQMYAEVVAASRSRRLDAFTADYGLNRGLAAGLVCVAIAVAVLEPQRWQILAVAMVASMLAIYRMHRRGRQYATELFVQFLVLAEKPAEGKS